MMYRKVLVTLISALFFSSQAYADNIVVIVSKKSTLQKLSLAQIKAIFLGETRYAAPGALVEINDRDRASDIYKEFYNSIASMSPKEVSIHWARKVFTGEAPPSARISGNDAAVIAWIKDRPEAISYIYEKNSNSSVKVVFSVLSK